MDDILFLVQRSYTKNEYGVDKPSETETQVFAQVQSVTQAEFFGGGRNGLNPEFKFSVCKADYSGEAICVYHGRRYAIYRTYAVPGSDYIELYAERKGGTNGEENKAG